MSPALLGYRTVTTLLQPLAGRWLRRRAARGKEDPARLNERLGRDAGRRPDGRLVWMHGASVGECLSLLVLIDVLRDIAPDVRVLVTAGTVTADALLARRLPHTVERRFAPLDLPGVARRFVRRWRPDLAVFAEGEVWPNLLHEARRGGARTALVSARLSAASLERWRRAPAAARALFGGFDLVMAQDDAVAEGLKRLGARDDGRLNLKISTGALPLDAAALALAEVATLGERVLVAASTHPGEDEVALDAFVRLKNRSLVKLVIAPRHPERGPEILALAEAHGLRATLRSRGPTGEWRQVHVADTLGELGLFFRLARQGSVLVGGSFAPGVGGHNPIEAVRDGAPIVRGPHVDNWRDVYRRLGDAAPVVMDAEELARAWAADLDVPEAAASRARRAGERLAEREPLQMAAAARALKRLAEA